jgi:predicted transcriptional regulator
MPARKGTSNGADRLTITLDSEDRKALQELSVQMDRSLAWIVRDAVRQYLASPRDTLGNTG